MTRLKIFGSLLIIVAAVAMVGGATLAWFTASTDPIDNEFVAGTVEIEADRVSHSSKLIVDNWNPGDCTDLELKVDNTGTKSIYLRAQLWDRWLPSAWRLLVAYTGENIQLLIVEWDSTCKGCTGTSGPIATGEFQYIGSVPNTETSSYMNGQFRNLENFNMKYDEEAGAYIPWLTNGTGYSVWCADSEREITGGWKENVQIFDPFCNENWYEEINMQSNAKWDSIPWAKIIYIINKIEDYLDPDGLNYGIMDIQQAIWRLTNPGGSFPNDSLHNNYSEDNMNAILADVEENYDLPTDNVDFAMNGWTEGPDSDGWWYYNGSINGIDGATISFVDLDFEVCLDGALTDNEYQGAQYWLTLIFEAIQSSHEAAFDQWGVGLVDSTWVPVEYNEDNQRWETVGGAKYWDGSAWNSI